MKRQVLKSILCLTLSAVMVFGEAGAALAGTEDASVETSTETAETAEAAEVDEEQPKTAETEMILNEEETEALVEAEAKVEEETETAAEAEAKVEEETEAEEEETEDVAEEEEVTVTEDTEESVDEIIDATGYQVVPASSATLPSVTGIAYDAETNYLSWNAVAGADMYEIEIVDPTTQEVLGAYRAYGLRREIDTDGEVWDESTETYVPRYTAGKAYTVKITAKSNNSIYIIGTPKNYYNASTGKWIDERYDTNGNLLAIYANADDYYTTTTHQWNADASYSDGGYWSSIYTYTYYSHPKSQPASASVVINRAKAAVNKRAVTQLSGIALKTLTDQRVEFTVSPFNFQESEYIRVEYANNAAFQSDEKTGYITGTAGNEKSSEGSVWADDGTESKSYYKYDANSNTFYVNLGLFLPGDTIYVRARVYNSQFELAANEQKTAMFSAYKTWSYKVPAAVIGSIYTTVTSSSVTLRPTIAEGSVTGFQFQRQSGKNWIDLGNYSGYNSYMDSGLTADTTYTYRVRGYCYNKRTKKTTYTGWQKASAYTWGASINLKASAASGTSVKLTWDKVAKADGYEIYRCDTSSSSYTYAKGQSEDSFSNMTLVKTINKAKTVKYTDKKLTAGKNYFYIIRAFRTVKKTKSYIQDSASIRLAANGNFTVTADYYTSTGTRKLEWNKMTGIKGYKIEKLDTVTGTYKAYKTLGAAKVNYTFPKVAAGKEDVQYRIYPYTKAKSLKSKTYYVTVEAVLGAVKNVKAAATTEGIKISWSKVSGADYYKVYRCTTDAYAYDKTRKTYDVDIDDAELVQSVTLNTDDVLDVKPYRTEAAHTSYDGKQKVGYYYNSGTAAYVENAEGKETIALYNSVKTDITSEITGTSVVDKAVTVNALVPKTEAEINADTEDGQYTGYKKDANGVLATEECTLVEGPESGITYYYVVKAYAKAKNGAAGNNTSVSSMDYTKPASAMFTAKSVKKATSLKTKSAKKGQATISYKKVSGAKGYLIYRATKKAGKYTIVGSSTKTSYIDTTAVAGKTYYYKVAAFTTSETGAYIFSNLTAAKKIKIKK